MKPKSRPARSELAIFNLDTGGIETVLETTRLIEAPNWSRDGVSLFFNSRGRILRLPAAGGTPEPVDTGFATRCNNDHGLSADGTMLVLSDQSQGDRRSRLYTLPIGGGAPRLVTEN